MPDVEIYPVIGKMAVFEKTGTWVCLKKKPLCLSSKKALVAILGVGVG